jgi:hypothetical protein
MDGTLALSLSEFMPSLGFECLRTLGLPMRQQSSRLAYKRCSTLKRAFSPELKIGKVELDTKVLTQFMPAIMRGER